MAEQKKYAGLDTLRTFLDNLKTTFATYSHSHTLSDITDYTVDSELSSTSTNPVQNSTLNAKFDAISDSFGALEASLGTTKGEFQEEIAEVRNSIVQGDWYENDPENPAYIHNRTHYEVYTTGIEIALTNLEFSEYGTNEDGQTIYSSTGSNDEFILEIGGAYVVQWPEYSVVEVLESCSGYGLDDSFDSLYYLGNIGILTYSGYDTGEPFCIVTDGSGSYTAYCRSSDTIEEIVVYAESHTVQQLDEIFIPDSIARTSDFYGMADIDELLGSKADVGHIHDEYLTQGELGNYYDATEIDAKIVDIDGKLEQKVNTTTLESYYTETEVDNLLSGKSDTSHNHNNDYDSKGAASEALTSANSYTDGKVANLASNSAVDTKISTHNTNTEAHNEIRDLIAELNEQLELFLDVDDTTKDQLSEVLALIEANKGTLESLTTSKINVSAIVDNLTTASTDKVLSANQGVVISDLISALSTELEALESTVNTHTHDDRYYTEAEINDQISTINTSITNIVDGVTVVAKASKDASGNVITSTYETKDDANNKENKIDAHIEDVSNPHSVTAAQVGALPITGGVLAGTLDVSAGGILLSSSTTGSTQIKQETPSYSISYTASDGTIKNEYFNSSTKQAVVNGILYSKNGFNAMGKPIDGVATPSNSYHAVNKLYVDSAVAAKANASDLDNYYTKTEIDSLELITIDDIDTIYGASIQSINEGVY